MKKNPDYLYSALGLIFLSIIQTGFVFYMKKYEEFFIVIPLISFAWGMFVFGKYFSQTTILQGAIDFKEIKSPFIVRYWLDYEPYVKNHCSMVLEVEGMGKCLVQNIPTSQNVWKDKPVIGKKYQIDKGIITLATIKIVS